jgi:hypothetical protein
MIYHFERDFFLNSFGENPLAIQVFSPKEAALLESGPLDFPAQVCLLLGPWGKFQAATEV